MRKPPIPAIKTPFKPGKIIREVTAVAAIAAIITHRTVRIFFLFAIAYLFNCKYRDNNLSGLCYFYCPKMESK